MLPLERSIDLNLFSVLKWFTAIFRSLQRGERAKSQSVVPKRQDVVLIVHFVSMIDKFQEST